MHVCVARRTRVDQTLATRLYVALRRNGVLELAHALGRVDRDLELELIRPCILSAYTLLNKLCESTLDVDLKLGVVRVSHGKSGV
jgi:hypothetical protein